MQTRTDATESSLPASVEEKRRVAFKSTNQAEVPSQRASDQATLTQASRSALLEQKRLEASRELSASQETDEALQAAFLIMNATQPTTPDVYNLDPDDNVEVMQQVYGPMSAPTEQDSATPLFRDASPTQTQA